MSGRQKCLVLPCRLGSSTTSTYCSLCCPLVALPGMSPAQQLFTHPEMAAAQQIQATLFTAVALHVPVPALCQTHHLGTRHTETQHKQGISQPSGVEAQQKHQLTHLITQHNQGFTHLTNGNNSTSRLSTKGSTTVIKSSNLQRATTQPGYSSYE